MLSDKSFQRGIQYLDDIQSLSKENLSPLIRQAIYQFAESRNTNASITLGAQTLPRIYKFFEGFVERNKEKIKRNPNISVVELKMDQNEFSLLNWDDLLESLPLFIEAIQSLPFKGESSLELSSQKCRFHAELDLEKNIEAERVKIYAITRKLLSLGIVLTFQSTQASESSLFIELLMTSDKHTGQSYVIDIGQKHIPLLGLSSIVDQFCISSEALLKKGRHLCIEIKEDLKVEKFYRPTRKSLETKTDCEILHFAFLFRPVSIIIPKKGCLIREAQLQEMLGYTGCGKDEPRQDVDESSRNYFFLDILSLMAC